LYFSSRPRDRDFAVGVFNHLEAIDVSAHSVHSLIQSIRIGKILRELSLISYDAAESRTDVSKVLESITRLNEATKDTGANDGDAASFEFITDDLNVLVDDSINKPGLRWRLNTLNRMLGSLRPGDFGFLFARPETGKTTFLASEVTHMAMQTSDPILWLNNEEQGNKVMLRCYQAALGLSMTELFRDLAGNKKKFYELTHGNIKLYDSGHIHKKQIEHMCKKLKPALIVVDQIDKIQGFDSDREDLRLGAIYQWFRELAKTYGAVMAVCQADGSGEGQKWLSMANVANAKTAKQAEADWILGIGKIHEVGFDQIRYLHASKNKLIGDTDSDPEQRHGRLEVVIEPDIARYRDL
jgi:replicative DNA helicase